METTKPSRSRSRKPKLENFYKNLGVRANATQASIRQKYIAAVKAFPPETHPEEFQQIRQAYETLRDPQKRREYDLMRKYGGNLEKIAKDVGNCVEKGEYEKAEKLIDQMLAYMPDNNPNLHLALAQIALLKNDLTAFQEQFDLVEKMVPDQDKSLIMVAKARMLLETELPEEAILVLDEVRSRYPEQIPRLLSLYSNAYRDLDREEDYWQLIMALVPAPGTETPEDLLIFIQWLNTMFDLEQWSFKSKIQQRFRKLLKSVVSEEDKLMIVDALQNEHDEYFDAGRFREAEVYIDFLYYLDSANPEIKEQRSQTQELMRLEKEIDRIMRDVDIFPPITAISYKWYYDESESLEQLETMLDIPLFNEPAGENLEIDEMYAKGIVSLRKKYPLLYRHFQDRWETLFFERVQHLNRETRRQLKL